VCCDDGKSSSQSILSEPFPDGEGSLRSMMSCVGSGANWNVSNRSETFIKSAGLLCRESKMKFRSIFKHRETFKVGCMCNVLRVSRSGYYAWIKRSQSQRSIENRKLQDKIRVLHAAIYYRRDLPHCLSYGNFWQTINAQSGLQES